MAGDNTHPRLEAAFDASDPVQVEKRKIEAARQEKLQREALIVLLENPAGRHWIFGLLDSCGMFATTFVPGQPDSTSYNEGRRSVALQIWVDLERAAPEMLIQARKEKRKE